MPDQPIEKWRATLERVIALQPDHISAYSLQVEERTAMLRWVQTGRVSEPDDDDVATMYELTQELLAQAGFAHYEISNWARSSTPLRSAQNAKHSIAHVTTLCTGTMSLILVLAAGRIRRLRAGVIRMCCIRVTTSSACNRREQRSSRREQIDRALEMGETMMLGLRLIEEGVERARFADRFGVELDEVYGATIASLWRKACSNPMRAEYV